MIRWIIGLGLVMAQAIAVASLPPAVAGDVPALSLRGDGTMRWMGLKVYDIRLWTSGARFSHAEPFALELVYDMNLAGKDIARKSLELIRGQRPIDETTLKRWGEAMARVFPDVRKGDTLIGVSIPGKEARFYTRERFLAAVPDPDFARAFFDIWLAESTTEPKVRARLLGGDGK